tara:strand:- start:7 stop:213 length:207 start_codon:yes stop_codon:yes gene_type:complete
MISKDRAKVFEELNDVADKECNLLADASINVGTIHEELIMLAYRYAPLKELRKLIKIGNKEIERLKQD